MKDFKILTDDTPMVRNLDRDFIKFCEPYYTTVCCLMSDPSCKVSLEWEKHSVNIVNECVFGEPNSETKGKKDGWPAIWRAADKVLKIGSCGNIHQYQAGSNCGLIQATYIKKGKNWYYKFGPKTLTVIEKLKEEPKMGNTVFYVEKDSDELSQFLKENKFEFVKVFGETGMQQMHELNCTHICICPNKKTFLLTKGTFGNPEISAKECIRKINGSLHGENYGI